MEDLERNVKGKGIHMQEDQVFMEAKDGGYEILLLQDGKSHPMEHRKSFDDAKDFAIYLANVMKLPAYYQNQKLN
jgi:hypothetical protein